MKSGAKVVGIIDKDWYLFDDRGVNINEMLSFKQNKLLNCKHPNIVKHDSQMEIYPDADIFVPAATSHTIDKQKLKILKNSRIKLIALGANNAFVDYDVEDEADNNFCVIADFIANSGMARCFSYLIKRDCVVSEEAIMKDIMLCINTAIDRVIKKSNSEYNLNSIAYDIALDNIENRKNKKS